MRLSFRSFGVLVVFLVFSFAEAEAQNCTANANWSFDPPPVNGMLELGATVEVCVDVVMYAPGGGAWLSGLELDFPPAWYLSTLSVVSVPEACAAGQGQWSYLDTLVCGMHHFGPGFYFDGNAYGTGLPDGNFCNNFGDPCPLMPENFTFCFSITLANDCPTDEENLFPRIRLVSDDFLSDFPSGCPIPVYVQPDMATLALNCCGEMAGTSPGAVAICESQCLFDLLEGAQTGGVWTGPAGYIDFQGCGYFDANVNTPGDYVYTLVDGMCDQLLTITVIDTDLGVLGVSGTACAGIIDLIPYLPEGTPEGGMWTNYVEAWESVFDCTPCAVGSNHNFLYTYATESGCTGSVDIELIIVNPGSGGNYTIAKCGDGSVLDLASLLPDSVGNGGIFSPSQEVVMLPQNSGTYTYTPSVVGCNGVVFTFNLDICDSLSYTDLTTTLTPDGNGYTVSFAITGGVGPYVVEGGGVISGNVFTSGTLPVGSYYAFYIWDSGPCNGVFISGGFEPQCMVSAGESPGEVEICQPEAFCLFDLLDSADGGGVWTGPTGWVDGGCGLVDPFANAPGDYYYTVSDASGCVDVSVITLVPIEQGVVDSLTSCESQGLDLNLSIENSGNGVWMAPGYPQVLDTVTDGFIAFDLNASGIYTYVFYEDGCLTSFGVDVLFAPEASDEVYFDPVTVCLTTSSFQPAGLIGIFNPAPSGSWMVYDASGSFIASFPQWNISFTGSELAEMGSELVFKFVQDLGPCEPDTLILPVFVSGSITVFEVSVCETDGFINLFNYLPGQTQPGGTWTNEAGVAITTNLDVSGLEQGLVYIYWYSTQNQSGCVDHIKLELSISENLSVGDDYAIDLCGSGEVIDLHDFLPDYISQNGTFLVPSILAIPANSGAYIYTLSTPGCADQTAVYTLTFTDMFNIDADAECNPGGTSFNVVLDISGGMPPYVVNGEVVEGGLFEVYDLAVANGEAFFVVEDAGLCDAIEIVIGVMDTDGDGICDDQQVTGCMDPLATNFNPFATHPGFCMYTAGEPADELSEFSSSGGKPGGGNVGANGGIGMADDELSLKVFPNPAKGEVKLDIRGLSFDDAVVEIIDILGSVRYRSVLASADGAVLKKIDLSEFVGGVYLVRVFDGVEDVVVRVVVL